MQAQHMPVELISATRNTCDSCCTRKNCLVNRFDDRIVRALSRVMRQPRPMEKGDRLYIQGDRFYSLYLIRSGAFKSCITDDTGDRQITGFHFPAEIIGLDGVESGRHLYEIEALETSSVCVIPFGQFEQISRHNNGDLYRHLVCAVSGSAFKESQLLMVLGRLHAEQRLASFLIDTSMRMRDRGESSREFNLSMARQDIANYLGLAIETVSRLFKRFEEEGLISAEGRHVRIVDTIGLHSIVAGERRFSGLRNIA